MITNGYCTLAELKAALGSSASAVDENKEMEAAIEAASRWIDGHCRTRFFTTAQDETRYFTAGASDHVFVDDIVPGSTVALATDDDSDRTYSTSWAAGDFEMEPANAALDGKPYRTIRTTPNGAHSFPTGRRAVRVTAKFGYASAPPAHVKRACIRRSAQLYRTAGATGGALGSGEYGGMAALPAPDAMVLFLLSEIANERISVA
jgi:hypothetical protein